MHRLEFAVLKKEYLRLYTLAVRCDLGCEGDTSEICGGLKTTSVAADAAKLSAGLQLKFKYTSRQ